MPADRRVLIGRVGRPHGTDGAFVVEGGSDDPRRFAVGASLLVDGHPARVVVSRRVGKGRRAVKLDSPAERGAALEVLRSQLPAPEEDAYYVADLVGLEVLEEGRPVGTVADVLPGIANDNLELDSGVLVPLVEDAIAAIDLDARKVLLNPGFIA